ncbi:MAG: hypothetical protein ACPGNV_05970 [Mangrovicoccus sp.]
MTWKTLAVLTLAAASLGACTEQQLKSGAVSTGAGAALGAGTAVVTGGSAAQGAMVGAAGGLIYEAVKDDI